MICLAWSISFILWAPAILFWQYIVGERTVQANECYIQFLSEPIITFCTAIAAFYLPVTIMATLFWKIYQETEKRAKDVQGLKGSGAGDSQSHNKGGGSVKAGGEGDTGGQKGSSAMTRQMSCQSSNSCDLNQLANNGGDGSMPREVGTRGRCCSFLFHFATLLPGSRASRRSINTTTTAGEAEQSSCDSLNNNEDPSGSEEDADGVDGKGWTLISSLVSTPRSSTA